MMDALPDFDPSPLLALRDATDADTAREIVGIFAGDAPTALAALSAALAAGDTEGVRKAAHRMKGAAGTIGLARAQECCLRIEQAARQGSLDAVPALSAVLAAAVDSGLARAREAAL
ncbi:MAG: Hpt domain [Planctomycetota bacterium]|jgi:HPt (histidine-containing phosphotransfer) domain-containing protein